MLQTPEASDISQATFDDSPLRAHRIFEPPNTPALAAIGRHKPIVLLCAVILALGGVALGLKRTPVFTASATLQVGQVNPNSPGFFGYTQSAASLATAFSRSIAAEPVLATIQHKLKLSPATAVGRLSSAPVPQAPAFRVAATGPSELAAVRLANVAAGAVIAYESESNNANPEAESLLHEYRNSSLRRQRAIEAVAHLTRDKHVSRSVLAHAEAERDAIGIKLRAIGTAYTGAVTSQAPRSGLVSLVAGAASASSDRKSKIELYGFLGLLLGVVVGCLVAFLWDRTMVRRRVGAQGHLDMPRSAPA